MAFVKVAFDVTSGSFPAGGVARYAHRLANSLRTLRGEELLPVALTHHRLIQRVEGVCHRRWPRHLLDWFWKRALPPNFETLVGPVDLVHVPLPLPVVSRCPQIVTVHDLAWLADDRFHPGQAPGPEEMQARFDRCRGVICVSESVARQLQALEPMRVALP